MKLGQFLQNFFQSASGAAIPGAPAAHPHLDDILIAAGGIAGRPYDPAGMHVAAESLLAMDMALAAGHEDGSIAADSAADYRARLVLMLEGKGCRRAESLADADRAAVPERLRPLQAAIARGLSDMSAVPSGGGRPGALSAEATMALSRAGLNRAVDGPAAGVPGYGGAGTGRTEPFRP